MPEPIWHWEYIDVPHSDLKECMLVMISDLRRSVSCIEDRIIYRRKVIINSMNNISYLMDEENKTKT